jgi:hypothetical protein
VRATLTRLGLADDEPLVRLAFAAIDGLSIQQLIYCEPARTEEALARLREILASLPPSRVAHDGEDGGRAG